jgi:hypothetical protein
MRGTGARFKPAPGFTTPAEAVPTAQCFRGANNGRAGTRRGTPGLVGRLTICTVGSSTSPPRSVRDVHGIDLIGAVITKVDTAQANRESTRG